MGNHRIENVIFVDTTDVTYDGPLKICGVKYIGAASGTLVIKADSAAGKSLYEAGGATSVFEEVEFRASDALHVAVTNGAKAYIYLAR